MALVIHAEPVSEPLTPQEVATRLGLIDVDPRLEALIKVARQSLDGVDGWLGRALITQSWDLYLDRFDGGEIRLPVPPFQQVDEIAITSASGVEISLPTTSWRTLKGDVGIIVPLASWPSPGVDRQGIRIRFTAGYGGAGSAVKEPIRQALVLIVGRLLAASRADMALRSREVEGVGSRTWMNPEDVRRGITATEDALLSPFRVWS